jgi:glutathione S-transferase
MTTTQTNTPMKLVYFCARGRAEPVRLMLELVGARYEYEGVPTEVWPTPEGKQRFLASTPLGQLPILHDGDFSLCQSSAIYKYVARKVGLYGTNLKEDARVDEVAETAGDILFDIGMLFWDPRFTERRPEHRQALRKKLGQVQDYFDRVAPDAHHWVLPGRYTLADVRMAYTLETVLPLHPGLVEEFPRLHGAMLRFFNTDGVRQYVRSDRRCRTYTVALATFGGKPEDTHQFTHD